MSHYDREKVDAARARARELLPELDAKFRAQFPGRGSVFDLTPVLVERRRYMTPQSTIDAFWHLVKLNDLDRLKAWLADRPKDRPTLLKLYEERKNVCA